MQPTATAFGVSRWIAPKRKTAMSFPTRHTTRLSLKRTPFFCASWEGEPRASSPGATPGGMGGWEGHPLERALEALLLGKQQLARSLETVGVPPLEGALEAGGA
jgi:hypothetical protein